MQVSECIPLVSLMDGWRSYALRSPRKRREAVFFPHFSNHRFTKENLVHNLAGENQRKKASERNTEDLKERRKKKKRWEGG